MSLLKALDYMKLASSYLSEREGEKAIACAMHALDVMEKAGVTPNDFNRIEIAEFKEEEEKSGQLPLNLVIKQAIE